MSQHIPDRTRGEERPDNAPPADKPPADKRLARVWADWKIGLGTVLGLLLISFVVQNVDAVSVKFLGWEAAVSQSLLVFLALSGGVALGALFKRRRRSSGRA